MKEKFDVLMPYLLAGILEDMDDDASIIRLTTLLEARY